MLKFVWALLAADVVGLVLIGTQISLFAGLILIGVVGALVLCVLVAAVRSEKRIDRSLTE